MKALLLLALLFPLSVSHAAEHRVVKGDTLSRIAARHGITVAELQKLNGLDSDLIRLGQILEVPDPVKPSVPSDELSALTEDEAMRVQIFLDSEGFGPGVVDGRIGSFTRKAAQNWIRAGRGSSLTGLAQQALRNVTESTRIVRVTEDIELGVLPTEVAERAKLDRLRYESRVEFMAERYHTSLAALVRLNPGVDLSRLQEGDPIRVPEVDPFVIQTWRVAVADPSVRIRVRHAERQLEVWSTEDRLLASFPISVGGKPGHLREGVWRVKNQVPNPTFAWNDSMLKAGVAKGTTHLLPPGPNNPVGILWMGLEPMGGGRSHIGFHGTDRPDRIGRSTSSGCIRLANWDVVRLTRWVDVGTVVVWEETPFPALGTPRAEVRDLAQR